MTRTSFAPGTVITNRNRLWRVGAQAGDVLIASPIDGGEIEPQQFCIPLEKVCPSRLGPPSPEIVGHPSSQDLLLRAYRLSLLHGTAPMLSPQRSRVIPKDYQLVPVAVPAYSPQPTAVSRPHACQVCGSAQRPTPRLKRARRWLTPWPSGVWSRCWKGLLRADVRYWWLNGKACADKCRNAGEARLRNGWAGLTTCHRAASTYLP